MIQLIPEHTSENIREDRSKHCQEDINTVQIAGFFNGITERVAFVDMEKKVLWANKAVVESLKLNQEKIKGRYCYQVLSQRRTLCDGCPLTRAGEIDKLEERITCGDDGKLWLIKSNPVRDDSGCIIALVETAAPIDN